MATEHSISTVSVHKKYSITSLHSISHGKQEGIHENTSIWNFLLLIMKHDEKIRLSNLDARYEILTLHTAFNM